VHLADWPEADRSAIDVDLEAEMAAARQVVTLGRAARTDAKIRVRQPLPRALVLVPGVEWSDAVRAEIASELNVKDVVVVTDLEGLLDVTVVPNFARLGKRLRDKLPRVKQLLAEADGTAVRRALEADNRYTLDVDGDAVVLEADDVEVRAAAHEELVVV